MQLAVLSSLSFSLLASLQARTIQQIEDQSDSQYFVSNGKNDTIGFFFGLYQNVLTVAINGTANGQGTEPRTFMLNPNLFYEYNSTVGPNNTRSISGFYDKLTGNNSAWGEGLVATKFASKASSGSAAVDVWEISGNWTGKDSPTFSTYMLIASDETVFRGLRLSPNAVTMVDSILNFPFKMQNGNVAYDQIISSNGSLDNFLRVGDRNNSTSNNGTAYGWLQVNDYALIGGKNQSVTLGTMGNEGLDIMVGNFTSIAQAKNWTHMDMLMMFNNSNGAGNITFEQKMFINMTGINNGTIAQNSASKHYGGSWTTLLTVIGSSLMALLLTFF